jgi:hypothetical protein
MARRSKTTLLKQLWPSAAHQLCLFHEESRVTAVVQQVYREVRNAIPKPPPAWAQAPNAGTENRPHPPEFRGRPRTLIPAADVTDLDAQAWRARHAARLAGIAQVHALRHGGLSVRGIARQTGLARQTIDAWLRQPVPGLDAGADEETPPAIPTGSDVAVSPQPAAPAMPALTMPPPPAPWASWEEVRQTQQQVSASQWLLLRRPDHLNAQQQAQVEGVLASPVGGHLQVARAFLVDWYGLWRDEHGQRQSLDAAQTRYQHWQTNPAYQAVVPLHKILAAVDGPRFAQLSQFLKHPTWEATNNGAERAGRAKGISRGHTSTCVRRRQSSMRSRRGPTSPRTRSCCRPPRRRADVDEAVNLGGFISPLLPERGIGRANVNYAVSLPRQDYGLSHSNPASRPSAPG